MVRRSLMIGFLILASFLFVARSDAALIEVISESYHIEGGLATGEGESYIFGGSFDQTVNFGSGPINQFTLSQTLTIGDVGFGDGVTTATSEIVMDSSSIFINAFAMGPGIGPEGIPYFYGGAAAHTELVFRPLVSNFIYTSYWSRNGGDIWFTDLTTGDGLPYFDLMGGLVSLDTSHVYSLIADAPGSSSFKYGWGRLVAVPEPSTVLLLGSGLLGLFGYGRRLLKK